AQAFQSVLPETPETYAIVELLKVYDTYDAHGSITLRRIGRAYDGGYVIPELAMQEAEVVMGYGISDDISFEDDASSLYGKPSFGFDGSSKSVKPKAPNCHFIPSNIVSEKFVKSLGNRVRTTTFGSFNQHLSWIGASDKKLFLKMDIEGNEYPVMPDILKHASKITGIVLEIHFAVVEQIEQALKLMQKLSQDFLLVHVHGNNCAESAFVTSNSKGELPRLFELTYINKNLVQSYEISRDQSHPKPFDMPNGSAMPDVSFTITY
ncbi:MAG TPA: FkbM family methyltransferase, partial [Chlamydiales bacterium]|nr:FkbM family methyltransferase [Chlamydiales bacterium]